MKEPWETDEWKPEARKWLASVKFNNEGGRVYMQRLIDEGKWYLFTQMQKDLQSDIDNFGYIRFTP